MAQARRGLNYITVTKFAGEVEFEKPALRQVWFAEQRLTDGNRIAQGQRVPYTPGDGYHIAQPRVGRNLCSPLHYSSVFFESRLIELCAGDGHHVAQRRRQELTPADHRTVVLQGGRL